MMLRVVITSLLLCILTPASSQDTLSYAEQLRAIELEIDSLLIFNIIDSLFSIEIAPKNELNIRLGYSSNVTSAGRDYDLKQGGLSSGVAYYHKSGFYTDLSGYWNNGVEPKYDPTILSAGYLAITSSRWSYSFDIEKWFYNANDPSENRLTNSISTSSSYHFKKASASIDYSFLFGKEKAHRIIGNLSWNTYLGKWWIFENISLYPSASIMFGNSDITQLRITQRISDTIIKNRLQNLNSFSNLGDQERRNLSALIISANNQGLITNSERFQLGQKIRNSSSLTNEDKETLFLVANSYNEIVEYTSSNKFSLLNYSFMFPISLSTGRLNILLSYTYSVPITHPDEFFSVNPVGYFSASISYRIPFK